MLPVVTELEINTNEIADPQTIKKTFSFDFSTGDFIVTDGKIVILENLDAIKMWIEKVLRTEKNRFEIYKNIEYGVTLEDLTVGQNYSQAFIEVELKREISEALLKNKYIKSLSGWFIKKENPVLNISFTVNLIDGLSFTQEVNI